MAVSARGRVLHVGNSHFTPIYLSSPSPKPDTQVRRDLVRIPRPVQAIVGPSLSPVRDVAVVVARLDLELTFPKKPLSREQSQSRLGDGEALQIAISSSQSPSTSSPATASGGNGHGGETRLKFDGQRCRDHPSDDDDSVGAPAKLKLIWDFSIWA
ncbi:hypothetical protein TIFTF001_020394 [Ficus carica]|uniref:Uncharacterized protein n=1 Tax=Ficus carica TaxID=3494 RepID=A0AA88AEU4_FICCA|nr:hypothetical protein TIFTF001_020394 [Ficus carica]